MAETHITDPTLLSVLQSATAARQQCLDLISLLETTGPQSPTSTPSDELSTAERSLSARLALLRSHYRKAVYGVRDSKSGTASARSEVDSLHLQLQNLLYEQQHLKGEIRGCEEFEHRYTTLPLVDVELFLEGREELRGEGEELLTRERIQDEGERRRELGRVREGLERRKAELVRETQGKKEELGRLDREVEKWLNGKEGVRGIFEEREKAKRKAEEASA